ncbi:MAG: hypothetical protein GWO21_04075 [Gammaproteobacteria bacterium]|nr:hypothetical protein [Gammaproteobacteria bacterium]
MSDDTSDKAASNWERVEAAVGALQGLDSEDLVTAVVMALAEREAPDTPRGLSLAVTAGIERLLGVELAECADYAPRVALAERVAAVGRGARLKSLDDTSVRLRELSGLIEVERVRVALHAEARGTDGAYEQIQRLCPALDQWRPPEARRRVKHIDPAAVGLALTMPSKTRRVADMAIAIGLRPDDREGARQAAAKALKQM